jgi:hypothetical protein
MRAYGGFVLLVALGFGTIPANTAHAEEGCLAAPSGRAPAGSEWHYQTDHVKQRKCWHLRPRGELTKRGAIVSQPAAPAPPSKADQIVSRQPDQASAAQPALRGSSVQGNTQQRQAGADAAVWPAPSSQAAPDNTAWPDPPSLAAASKVAWPDPPAPIVANRAQDPDGSAFDQNFASDAGAESGIIEEGSVARSTISIGALFLFTVGLIFTSILWGRRYRIQLEQSPANGEFYQLGDDSPDVNSDGRLASFCKLLSNKQL